MTDVHVKARKTPYSGTKDVQRTPVPDEKVPWSVSWSDYEPTEYTAPEVTKNPVWADNPEPKKIEKYNALDGKIDRTSLTGTYQIDPASNRPLNPQGRTGLSGRGLLGRWGPNHAGDPVVTRWAKDEKHRVLEIILVKRKDTGEKALPGGMVDAGEHVSAAIKREFIEEAMNSSPTAKEQIEKLFQHPVPIYQGYMDDPRNTDNAWMETQAMNMHDEKGDLTKDLQLEAGDDASKVRWVKMDRDHNLYAGHEMIIKTVIREHGAYQYWQEE